MTTDRKQMTKKKLFGTWKGKITPTNSWYRDPSGSQYFTGNAMQKRVDQDRIAKQTRQTKKLNTETKVKVHAAIGKQAPEVVQRIQSLISGYDYGLGHPTHINYRGKSWPSKLKASDIYNHLAGNKTIYYTAQPYRSGNVAVVMATLDIDNPGHCKNSQSDKARKAKDRFVSDIKKIGAHPMVQISTHDNGFHVTLCILFPSNLRDYQIRQLLNNLRSDIAACYKSCGCHEVCLKGMNYSRIGQDPALYGTLVRLPKINDPAMADEFLLMTDKLVSISDLSSFYSESKPDINHNAESLLVDTAAIETTISSWGDKSSIVSKYGSKGISQGRGNGPLGRMKKAASMFAHEKKRLPNTAQELICFYESLGFHTGVAQADRLVRAEIALKWITKNHNFAPPSEQSLYTKWLKHFELKKYSKQRMTYTTGRFIRPCHLALVAAIIEHKQLSNHERGIAKNYFIDASRGKKKRGEIEFVLDNKKFAHCISLLVAEKIVEIVELSTLREATKYRIRSVQESEKE